MRLLLPLLLLLLAVSPLRAEDLVLVPGYLGDAGGFEHYGVTPALERAGWHRGGHLVASPAGVGIREAEPRAGRRYFTLDLPTEAPLMLQAERLAAYLGLLRRRYGDDSPLYLAGHSAGGVVARLTMVLHPEADVAGLITIASPHLGTDTAELGLLAGRSPLAMLAPLIGADTLNRSQALYRDLAPERSGNLLFWLNRQPHPPARYVAVVRVAGHEWDPGDLLVPAWSQDLNQVQALRGRALRIERTGGHLLAPEDGALLARILDWFRST